MKLVMNFLRYIGIIIYYFPLEHIFKRNNRKNIENIFPKISLIGTRGLAAAATPRGILRLRDLKIGTRGLVAAATPRGVLRLRDLKIGTRGLVSAATPRGVLRLRDLKIGTRGL